MRFRCWQQYGCSFGQIQNWCSNDHGSRRRKMIRRNGVPVGADFGRIAACRVLAALVISARAIMALMRGAGAVVLVGAARGRGAFWSPTGAQTDAVDQQRQHHNDCDMDSELHRKRATPGQRRALHASGL